MGYKTFKHSYKAFLCSFSQITNRSFDEKKMFRNFEKYNIVVVCIVLAKDDLTVVNGFDCWNL